MPRVARVPGNRAWGEDEVDISDDTSEASHMSAYDHFDHHFVYSFANRATTPSCLGLTSLGAEMLPMVFIHGIGIGIFPYLHVIMMIVRQCPSRPMLFVEIPSVFVGSMRSGFESLEFDHVARSIALCCDELGWSKVGVMAHSYGSMVTSRIIKMYPGLVDAMCIMDPVALMTSYPQLVCNFVYKLFVQQRGADTYVKDALKAFAARDLVIAHTFCRIFDW